MHPTQKTLLRAAKFFSNNPNAFSNGDSIGSVITDHATFANADAHECLEAVREAIGMSGVTGALSVWASKHTAAEAASLLRRVATEFSHQPA